VREGLNRKRKKRVEEPSSSNYTETSRAAEGGKRSNISGWTRHRTGGMNRTKISSHNIVSPYTQTKQKRTDENLSQSNYCHHDKEPNPET
jgi:hypothetical protein